MNLRLRGVNAFVCMPLHSVCDYTSVGVSLSCVVRKVTCPSPVAKKTDAWMVKELRKSLRLHTVAYTENNVYNICVWRERHARDVRSKEPFG